MSGTLRRMPLDLATLFRTDPHLLLTTSELCAHGYSREQIIALAQLDEIDRLLHGLYTLADVEVPSTQRAAIPLRYLGQRQPEDHQPAVLTGPVPLAAHEVGPFHLTQIPTVNVDPRCRVRPDNHRFRVRRRPLDVDSIRMAKNLRTAPLGVCLADTAADNGVSDKALRLTVQQVRTKRLSDMPALRAEWRTIRNAGSRRLEELLAAGEFEFESEGERDAFHALFDGFPPQPDCQVLVLGQLRADFVFVSAGLIIEYYGKDVHASQVDADAARVHALEAAGWRVIVVTVSMLRNARRVAARIHAVRREREQRIQAGELLAPTLPSQPPRTRPLRTLLPFG